MKSGKHSVAQEGRGNPSHPGLKSWNESGHAGHRGLRRPRYCSEVMRVCIIFERRLNVLQASYVKGQPGGYRRFLCDVRLECHAEADHPRRQEMREMQP